MWEHPTCENTPRVKLPVTRKVCTKKVLKEIQNLPGELENLFGRTSAHPRPRPGSVSAHPVRTLVSQSLLKMKYWNWIDFNWMWTMWLQGQAWRHTWGKITSAGHPWSQRPGSGSSGAAASQDSGSSHLSTHSLPLGHWGTDWGRDGRDERGDPRGRPQAGGGGQAQQLLQRGLRYHQEWAGMWLKMRISFSFFFVSGSDVYRFDLRWST